MDLNIGLCCPLCKKSLLRQENSFSCENHHSFDLARQGYLHLLPVQQKHSLNPGDTKEMLLSRRRFLDGAFYLPIAKSVTNALLQFAPLKPTVVDVGCGEGYYTAYMKSHCPGHYAGVDISKDGVRMACSRSREISWLVATASSLLFGDGAVDAVTCMFSLLLPEEYGRILKKGGCVVEVTVGSEHLRELKEIIYDEVFEQHKQPSPCPKGFDEVRREEHRFSVTLANGPLCDLLHMTPHFWRIHQQRREQLEATNALRLTVHYWTRVLVKQ